MDIQEKSIQKSIEILESLYSTQTAIQRNGTFPLLLLDSSERTREHYVRIFDMNRQHPFEEMNPNRRIIRISSRENFLHLLIRYSLGLQEGIDETLGLFQKEPWPDEIPNSIKYHCEIEKAQDLDHILQLDNLVVLERKKDQFYNWDRREWRTRADIYAGMLLTQLSHKDNESLIKGFISEPQVLTVTYDCEDMNRRYDLLKTALAGILVEMNRKHSVARKYLSLIDEMNNNVFLYCDVEDSLYAVGTDYTKKGQISRCASVYLLEFLLGGSKYKKFVEFINERFPKEYPLISEVHIDRKNHRYYSESATAWYSIFLNAIGLKEEAFERLQSLDHVEKKVEHLRMHFNKYHHLIGPEPFLIKALAYAEIGRDKSIFQIN